MKPEIIARLLSMTLGLACTVLPVRGELTGQQKALAIEAARTDLYAQLMRQIKGIQVSETTIVANMVTEDATRSGSMDGYIRGATIGEPQFVGDACIIPGSITLQQVVENVNTMTRTSGGTTIGLAKVEQLNTFRLVRAQGMGSVRASPAGATPMAANDLETGLTETLNKLKGPGQFKLGAIEAARIDALAQLARQIKGVRISDSAVVFNMATESRWTDTDTTALVQGAVVLRYVAVDPELVACTMQITLQQVAENIERTSVTKTVGSVHALTSQQVNERIQRYNPALTRVTATGYGAIRNPHAQAIPATTEVIGTVR